MNETKQSAAPPDWRGLCEEPVNELYGYASTNLYHDSHALLDRARLALAQPEPEMVGPTDEELLDLYLGWDPQKGTVFMPHPAEYARAVLARWGRPAPAPAGEGSSDPIIPSRYTGYEVDVYRDGFHEGYKHGITRAADLLERQAVPVPVASDTRYEFSVYNEDHIIEANGSAPTYAQALSEGQHYLAQYLQDGPHTLELRRVEVLSSGEVEHG